MSPGENFKKKADDLNEAGLRENIRESDYPGLDILPSNLAYRNFDLLLDRMRKSRKQLRWFLNDLAASYDYVILDCPPNITLLSENVFRASHLILVPVIPTPLSERTLEQLFRFFGEMELPTEILVPFFSMARKPEPDPPKRSNLPRSTDVLEDGYSLYGLNRKDGAAEEARSRLRFQASGGPGLSRPLRRNSRTLEARKRPLSDRGKMGIEANGGIGHLLRTLPKGGLSKSVRNRPAKKDNLGMRREAQRRSTAASQLRRRRTAPVREECDLAEARVYWLQTRTGLSDRNRRRHRGIAEG